MTGEAHGTDLKCGAAMALSMRGDQNGSVLHFHESLEETCKQPAPRVVMVPEQLARLPTQNFKPTPEPSTDALTMGSEPVTADKSSRAWESA